MKLALTKMVVAAAFASCTFGAQKASAGLGGYAACVSAACAVFCTACLPMLAATPAVYLACCQPLCGNSAAMCNFSWFACLDDSTKVIVRSALNGEAIERKVQAVIRGDLVLTIHPYTAAPAWTRVRSNIAYESSSNADHFEFIELLTETHKAINVTEDHVMVIGVGVEWHNKLAGQVVCGDVVMDQNGVAVRVTDVRRHQKRLKYDLVTEDGTVLANGVLVSTVCADNFASSSRFETGKLGTSEFAATLATWRRDHAGESSSRW